MLHPSSVGLTEQSFCQKLGCEGLKLSWFCWYYSSWNMWIWSTCWRCSGGKDGSIWCLSSVNRRSSMSWTNTLEGRSGGKTVAEACNWLSPHDLFKCGWVTFGRKCILNHIALSLALCLNTAWKVWEASSVAYGLPLKSLCVHLFIRSIAYKSRAAERIRRALQRRSRDCCQEISKMVLAAAWGRYNQVFRKINTVVTR